MAIDEAKDSIVVRFPAGLYHIDAIKRAAYRFTDKLAIDIQPSADGVSCTLRPLSAKADLSILEGDFRNEVLDQDLRITIGKETEQVRNLVLSLAFSKTGLQE
jgi:His-Xaa-Ser system protein HxsD